MSDSIENYDFELPRELIAQQPLPNREDARLMLVDRNRQEIHHHHVRDLPDLLRPHDCLVVNNTRVINAKLVGYRVSTGGRWQGLFLEADPAGNWRMLAKTRGRIKVGEQVRLQDRDGRDTILLTLVARMEDGSWVGHPESDETTDSLLARIGRVPLPHYIRGGNMVDADLRDYQTIYARNAGAIAAPTAGLHFTERLVRELIDRGVNWAQLTLHVGEGTFRPVSSEQLSEHQMHSEWGTIDQAAVDNIQRSRDEGGRLIAIGTTSVRVLESAASDGTLKPWTGETDLFIRPGYRFQTVDALMTNFHLPRSTLIVLVRTFGGEDLMKRAYEEAVAEKYRFFSYGDAMLII